MSTPDADPARLRGGVVGAASGMTAIAAHGIAQGMLPSTDALMVVIAAAAALGAVVHAVPRIPGLPALLAGQGLVHLLLVALTGHHHDLLNPTMAVTHGVGTIAALALIATFDAVARVVRRIATVLPSPSAPIHHSLPVPAGRTCVPAPLVFLGSVGLRGPPLSV